jgi:hypothetical protein
MDPSPLPEPRVAEMIAGVKDYMRKEQATASFTPSR